MSNTLRTLFVVFGAAALITACGDETEDPGVQIDEATALIDLSDEQATLICEDIVGWAESAQEGHDQAALTCMAAAVAEENAEACETAFSACIADGTADGGRLYSFLDVTCDADSVSRINDCAEATAGDYNRCWMSRFDARTMLYDMLDTRGCELAGDEEGLMDIEALIINANIENDRTPECEGIQPC